MSDKTVAAHLAVVELAVLIGRQPAASALTPNAVAKEAARFYTAASRLVGSATAAPGMRDGGRETLQAMADRWGGIVETPHDPHGMTVGLRFPGRYTSGLANVFFVC